MSSLFHLRLCAPLDPDDPDAALVTIAEQDINPEVTSLEVTTVNPGGYGALNVGMQAFLTDGPGPDYTRMETPAWLPPRAHVELYAGSFPVFEGAVMVVNKNSSGRADGFIAEGYGITSVNDNFIESVEVTPKTSGVILAEALRDAATLLRIGPTYVDPGVLHLKSEFHAMFPGDVINQIIREGGAAYSGVVSNAGGASGDVSNGVWDFLVYEGRQVVFRPRIPPAGTPDDPIPYHVPYDDRITSWVEDYHKLVGQVAIRYKLASGATTLTPRVPGFGTAPYQAFKDQFGFMRAAVVEGGTMTDAGATTFAGTFLAQRSQPSYAVRLVRAQQQGMEQTGGPDIPPYLVRAGEWVSIGDQLPLPIVQTTYDAFSEVLTVDCGDALPHGLVDLRTLHRVASHVIRGTNPVTGARA